MTELTRRVLIGVLAMSVWVAPSQTQEQDISGTWQFAVQLEIGEGRPMFVFTQSGETLSGTYQGTFDAADLSGTIQGDRIEFSFELQGSTVTYTGTVDDNTMSGTCNYGDIGSGVWEGAKAEGE